MQPTSAAWNALLAAFRAGVGTEALFAVVIPSRALALTSRLWPPGVLPAAYVLYPYLAPTGQGIGQLSLELADDRSSRRGSVSCQVATQAGQLGSVQGSLLTQLLSIGEQPAQVLGAFVGGQAHDQVALRTLFTGRVTDLRLTRGTLSFTLVDGIDTDHRDIEIPVGATAFPGSPLDAHGQSIPLIIGTALGLQPLLVGGEAVATLATALPAADVPHIALVETAAAFPGNTTLLIESETLTYDGRRVGLLPDGTSTLQLLNPVRLAPEMHAAGTLVAIAPPIQYRYLVGIGLGALELLAVRDQDGPIADFAFSTDFPGVPLGTGVLNLSEPHEGVNVDVQVIPDPPGPVLLNGGFEDGVLTPWVALAGTTAVVTAQEALAGNHKLQLRQLGTTPQGVYQDVAVEVGKRYTVLVYWRTPASTQDNAVDNGDFTDPTDAGWEIDTGGTVDIEDEYRPGTVGDDETVYNGAQTFTLPVAPFVELVPDPVHPEVVHLQAAGYRSFNCVMSQPITTVPGQTIFVDVRVRAWNQAAGADDRFLPGVVGIPGVGGSSALNVHGTLPPLCEVQVHVTMSSEYSHFLRPDQPRTDVGRMAEWRCEGGATHFTPTLSAYTFRINVFGRYIGTVPPIEVTSAVVVPAPPEWVPPEPEEEPTPEPEEEPEEEPPPIVPLQASGLIQLGTPTDPTLYTTRIVRGPTTWQVLALSFVATDATLRLSLLGEHPETGALVEYDGVRFLPAGRNPVRVMDAVFAQFLPHLTLSATSVETAATRRDGWLFSGYVPEPGRTDALLTKMSQECCCTLYKDAQGVYQIVADDYDMPVALHLDSDRDVHQGSAGLAWGNPQEVYTDFYLWYQRVSTQVTTNQAGQYAAVLYVTPEASISLNPDLQTLCAQARESTGTRRRFDYHADLIADPATADLLLTRLVQQFTLLAQALTVEASLAAVPLEVTDRVAVKTALVGPQPFVGEVRQTTLATSLQAPGLAVGLRVRQVGGMRGVWEAWDSWAVEGPLGPPGTTRVREQWEEEEPPPEPSETWFFQSAFAPPATCCYGLLGVEPGQLDLAAGASPGTAPGSHTAAPVSLFRNSNVASGVWDAGLTLAGGGLGAALAVYNGEVYVAVRPAAAPTAYQLWQLEASSSGTGAGTLALTLPSGFHITCMQEYDGLGDGNWLYLGTDDHRVSRWNGTTLEALPVLGNPPDTEGPMRAFTRFGARLYVVSQSQNRLDIRTSEVMLFLPGPVPSVVIRANFDGESVSTVVTFAGGIWLAIGSAAATQIDVVRYEPDAEGDLLVDVYPAFPALSAQQPGVLGVYGGRLYLGRVSTTATPRLELWRSSDGITWELAADLATLLAGDSTPDTNTGITALAVARDRFYAATSTLGVGPAPGLRVYCTPIAEGLV